MDPNQNQQTNQSPPVIQAAASPAVSTPVSTPAVPPVSPQPMMSEGHGPSKLLWLMIFLLLGLFVILVVVYLRGGLKTEAPTTQTLYPTVVPSPTLTDEQDVNNIDLGSIEADLRDIKADLQAL